MITSRAFVFALLLVFTAAPTFARPPSPDAAVATRSKPARRPPGKGKPRKPKEPSEITATVDAAVGPALYLIGGPEDGRYRGAVYDDQHVHTGLRLSVAAVLDEEFAARHPKLVPKAYRKMFAGGNEVLYTPGQLALLPGWILLSPKTRNTGMAGATWRLLGAGLGFGTHPVRFGVGAGLVATYAYVSSDTLPSPTHFLRPGIDLNVDLRFTLTKSLLVSIGWDSQIYVPQALGGSILEVPGPDVPRILHMGIAYLQLHFRFPYTTSL